MDANGDGPHRSEQPITTDRAIWASQNVLTPARVPPNIPAMRTIFGTPLIALAIATLFPETSPAADRPNVLFIAVDDMRPQLGCYGDPLAKTPRMDRLASRGLLFERAYCQQALCSPSRISLLSGRYPATSGIYSIGPFLRETMPDIVTLPQHFKNNGYFTRSLGKVYHVGIDDPDSWSVPPWHSKAPRNGPGGEASIKKYRAEMQATGKEIPKKGKGAANFAVPAFDNPDVGDDDLLDGDTTKNAIESLKELAAKKGEPFFLAVGYANPHVPWVAPKKYWDLYRSADIPLPDNRYVPRKAPEFAAKSGQDFMWYGNIPADKVITDEFGRECLHGYLAAISYVDALVGRLIDALDASPAAKNTVVILWSDHGYYMGEHNWWGSKHNNYEGATRAVLMMAAPGQKHPGSKTRSLTDFVDIFPSLAEICGLPKPVGAEGRSFAPLLQDPKAEIKDCAFSFYPMGGYLGIAMRTDRWRFVEWTKAGQEPVRELYDHETDPAENENVAGDPAHAALIKELSAKLAERFPAEKRNAK